MNVAVIHLIQIWGEKSCFMYSEETGNRSASGPIVPKVKHSHPEVQFILKLEGAKVK